MLRINYLHGLAASFRIWNRPIRYFHSLDQNKHRTPTRHKFAKTSKNPVKTLDVEPKVYMRDTISNIYKILRYSTWDSAETQLKQLPLKWDSFTVNQVLKTHPPMEKAWLFFNWVDKVRGFKHDQFTYTTMLDIFGEAGRVSSMKYLFQQMQEKGLKIDVVTYTSSLYWLSKSGDFDGAMETWEEMRGKYEEALEIFNKMQEAGVKPDKAACNILVEKCCKAGETWPIIRILQYMKENFIVLRYPIFLIALETLRAAGESDALLRQVHPHISVECISNDRVIEYKGNESEAPLSLDRGLVWVLLKKQNLLAIDGLLTELLDRNIQLDSEVMSSVIHVNCNRCRPDGDLFAFKYSVKTGIGLERTAYLALIGCLIRSNMFTDIVDIVMEMTSARHSLGVYLASLLFYRLGCARRPSCAAKIFDLLPDDQKCVATYTALVGIYFAAGTADKGLKIYKIMRRKGIHPSLGTYCVLVAGLEKLGGVSNAEAFRKEKKILQKDAYFHESIPIEEKICDLLFARDVVS